MFAVIDLETTGGSSARDKITEIAIIVHDGTRRVREYSSLVNPERPIPNYITDITGISDDMVYDAPKFYEIAKTVVEMTEGCIFVAHNVNFDYGFLQKEFRELGFDYSRDKLCTVRTSRKLIPGLRSYSLGKLCHALGIDIFDRHRAMGDAEATVILLEQLLTIDPNLARFSKPVLRKDPYEGLPPNIDRNNLRQLPDSPGLYFFHDVAGNTLYADKASNIRRTALKRLRTAPKVGKEKVTLSEICEVTWELTGNELLASLRMDQELERRAAAPVKRRAARRNRVGVVAYQDQRNYIRLIISKLQKGGDYLAEFPTEEDARNALESRLRRHQLCATLLGLEHGQGACSYHAAGTCKGACLGQEAPAIYNERLESALPGLGFPYPRFLLLGNGRSRDEVSVLYVDDGACHGYAYLDVGEAWSDPDLVLDMLKPLASPPKSGQIVRQFLPKVKQTQIFPF